MSKSHIKLGLLIIAVLQIAAIFYLLRVLKNFTNNPKNYYNNLLTHQIEETNKIKKSINNF